MIASIIYEGRIKIFNVGSGLGRSINQIAADIERLFPNTVVRRIYRDSRPVDVPANVFDIGLIEQEMNWSPKVAWQQVWKIPPEG
jgi:UDP-glucose 4-epimerase